MTIDEILITVTPGETRVALMAQSRLSELMVVRPDLTSITDNIYLGRVERALTSIQAAFVDIGLGRSGFLALPEARPLGTPGSDDQRITDWVTEGDTVLVQALSEPASDKGAKLTTHITLPGRFIVLAPNQPGVRVSRRIESADERDRLTGLIGELAEEGEGFIVRTAAEGADGAALERDVAYLRATWNEIEEKLGAARPPASLYWELAPLRRILRDETGPELESIVIDDAASLAEARFFCRRVAPDLTDLLQLYDRDLPLFEAHGVDEQIDAALARRVDLAGGGSIVIDEVTALTAIDVNTGGRSESGAEETALRTNLEAAAEIARQLRLRNIAGTIIIDFVPMRRRDNGTQVVEALRKAVTGDRSPTHVFGFSRLGLVEMTRQRRRPALARSLLADCPACGGAGRTRSADTVAFDILRALPRAARTTPGAGLTVTAAPSVVTALEGPVAASFAGVVERLGARPALIADTACDPEAFDIAAEYRQGGSHDG